MSTTVSGTFESTTQTHNVQDDLRSSGLPTEQVFVDEAAGKVRVVIADATAPGIVEIFERHHPKAITRSTPRPVGKGTA